MSVLDILAKPLAHFGIPTGKLGNVVFLPGILGTDLADDENRELWIFPPRLKELLLSSDGKSEDNSKRVVHPTAPNFPHAAMLHVLNLSWNVLSFGYDWRKDIRESALKLDVAVRQRFGNEAFHIVAHSMGGLVARVLRANSPDIQRGGKLVMLCTPNHGSYLALHALTLGVAAQALFGLFRAPVAPADALAAAQTWPGLYQLVPSPVKDPAIQGFYSAPPPGLSRAHVDDARALHEFLAKVPSHDDFVYIGGANLPTVDGMKFLPTTTDGDGVVSHRLGFLSGVRTFTLPGGHVDLLSNPFVLASISPLLHGDIQGLL
ncbi:MAG TPA: alpha/beta fold hydrolase [Thermoanaerobaculia bacterium]|nr:alpha/beta fold hydrolase [Thermoanaerobaculia bacterium]